jgi:hypothetical protein
MNNISCPIKLMPQGEYFVERLSAADEVLETLGWFDNLILDSGLNWILSRDLGPDILNECRIGTGNQAEDVSQTQLQSQTDVVLYTASGGSRVDTINASPPYYEEVTAVYLFPAFAVSRNISELGVGPSTGGSALFTRALVKDPMGVPTSITVLVGEKLRVTYRCRLYYQMDSDVAGVVNISGVDYSYTGRMYYLGGTNSAQARGNWYDGSGWRLMPGQASFPDYGRCVGQATGLAAANTDGYPPRTGSFQGNLTSNDFSASAYTPGSFTRDLSIVVPDTSNNFAPGINWVSLLSPLGFYQYLFSPSIPKTADYRLRITFTFTVARYAP